MQEQEAEEAALLLSNTKEISMIRCAHLKQIFSDDRPSMRALKNGKEKLDKVDPFLLYSYNNEKEDASKPTCVYKSSLESIKIALEMNTLDKKNISPMREEFLFMDTMHNRVRVMKMVMLWMYSSITRTMLRITTFECEKEDKRNLQHFLELFLTSLRQVKGDDKYQYLPCGFLVDAAGANFLGIKGVFGKAGVLRTAVCQSHFKRCTHANMLKHVPDEYEESYKKHVNDLCVAPTEVEYQCIITALRFICEECNCPGWLDWWEARRIHFIPAYKGFSIPILNMAEIGQSTLRDDSPLMLIDVAYLDVSSIFIQNPRYNAVKKNQPQLDRGRGPCGRQVAERECAQQVARGDIYMDNLVGQMNMSEIRAFLSEDEEEHRSSDSLPDFPLPIPTAKHKAPKKFSEKNPTQMTGNRKKSPKRTSSSTDEGSPPKRSFPPMDKANTKEMSLRSALDKEGKVPFQRRRRRSLPKMMRLTYQIWKKSTTYLCQKASTN